MKNTKISRRSFLLGLAACSAAGVLTACSGSSEPASSASTAPEPPASSAASEVTAAPFLTVEDFPALDGSTACIPLMAQMLADTTGMDLEEAQSIISVSTTAYAWESFGLYNTDTKMLVVYEAPDSVKEELEAANVQLEQKPIGVDALVFIVNEDNPVTDLTQQQLRDIYAGKITNWKERSRTMKAPVGLLSDRTVLRQQDGGASPRQVPIYRVTKTIHPSADNPKTVVRFFIR